MQAHLQTYEIKTPILRNSTRAAARNQEGREGNVFRD